MINSATFLEILLNVSMNILFPSAGELLLFPLYPPETKHDSRAHDS